jgi:hypothetical protein
MNQMLAEAPYSNLPKVVSRMGDGNSGNGQDVD